MPIPDAHGVKYLDVVTLCWLAYKENGVKTGDVWTSCVGTSWQIKNVYEIGPFRAILAQGSGKLILSFSGTDELLDWLDNISQGLTGVSGQYLAAQVVASGATCNMVVGHSLGGGLASFVAIHQGKMAATVNPAPLHILPTPVGAANIINMIRNGSKVVNYVVHFEALDLLDIAALSMRRVGRIIHVPSTGSDPIQKHLLDHLVGFTPPRKR